MAFRLQSAAGEENGSTVLVRRRRRRDDSEMDITPMIDIVFLLLIFFLVASKIETSAQVSLPPARHGIPVSGKNSVVVVIVRETPTTVKVMREDGTEISAGSIEEMQQAVAQYVLDGLLGADGAPKQTVLIKAEKDLKHREVARVIEAMNIVKQQVDTLGTIHIAVLEST